MVMDLSTFQSILTLVIGQLGYVFNLMNVWYITTTITVLDIFCAVIIVEELWAFIVEMME